MPKVKREAEAYLEERKLARDIKRGRYDSADCVADRGLVEEGIRARYQPKIDQGWPDILSDTGKMPSFGRKTVFTKVASFHGEIQAVGPEQLAGKKLYRAFGNPSERSPWPGGSKAGGRQPAFWGLGALPQNAKEWRERVAVLDEWNGNGFIAIVQFPVDLAKRLPEAKGWAGQIAEQYGTKLQSQYLSGGGEQLIIDLGPLAEEITGAGEKLKRGEAIMPIEWHGMEWNGMEWNGIKVELRPTNWDNVEGLYGYSRFDDHFTHAARTRRLATDEIQTKISNSKTAAAARAGSVDQEHRR